MEFKEQYDKYKKIIENKLKEYCENRISKEDTLVEAVKYSLLAGGKRLRPVLSLAVCDMLNGDYEDVLPFACAIEMIHTYSLIHDDLPSLDNDDYRRGRLTNHKVFGEAMAIMAGDCLLNLAFEIMTSHILDCEIEKSKNYIKAMEYIAKSSGGNGMIGGQIVDLESEGKKIDSDTLKYMHSKKTGALISASVMSAFFATNGENEYLEKLMSYSLNLGVAFQIRDDILDVIGDNEKLGKNTGSDELNEKSTYVTIYGIDKSQKLLDEVTNNSILAISSIKNNRFLSKLASYLVNRDN